MKWLPMKPAPPVTRIDILASSPLKLQMLARARDSCRSKRGGVYSCGEGGSTAKPGGASGLAGIGLAVELVRLDVLLHRPRRAEAEALPGRAAGAEVSAAELDERHVD